MAEAAEARSALAHQFEDLGQQMEAATLGMWLFLITEIMFFGGLFTGYAVYRFKYYDAFVAGSHELSILLGGINTGVLIASSLTMALGVHAAQQGRRNALVVFLVLTIVLGGVFLGIKVVEYKDKFEHHLVPGSSFHYEPHVSARSGVRADPRHVQLFFSFYFAMTGMHALHMVIGVGLMTVLLGMALRNRFSPQWYSPVEMSGLYWHFVDIVWIFLFPLLYLIGLHA
jgi:cytochrome c oxidase subunit 3